MAKRRIITFELRPTKDDDLVEALDKEIKERGEDRSDIIRSALRSYLLTDWIQKKPLALDTIISLETKEKDDDQVAADLDSLLNNF
jgi:metal-responsive CopG/Arc/MetJ family transcriptional regulator